MVRDGWCLIESDPGVFTEVVNALGVNDVQFEEILNLEPNCFNELVARYGKVYGIIFLFKWEPHEMESLEKVPNNRLFSEWQAEALDLFFAHQIIPNACATQAILFILMNQENQECSSAPLRELKDFTRGFDASLKGLALSNSEILRSAHNSFGTVLDTEVNDNASTSGESFHYISFIPFKNKFVLELDGLKKAPIKIGNISLSLENEWLEVVRSELISRVSKAQAKRDGGSKGSELCFNVMVAVKNPLETLKRRLNDLRLKRSTAVIQLMSLGEKPNLKLLAENSSLAYTPDLLEPCLSVENLQQIVAETSEEINELSVWEADELAKRQKWKTENERRQHNFIPFILCALRHLARTGALKKNFDYLSRRQQSQ